MFFYISLINKQEVRTVKSTLQLRITIYVSTTLKITVFIFSHVITEYVAPGAIPVCASVCVCVCVCLSQPFIWTPWDRFRWNLDHMILTKIWDETFLNFFKCCINYVITAFYVLRWGTLTPSIVVQFSSNLHIFLCTVWDCNPTFSVHIFSPKWRLEKQFKIKVT